MYILGDDVYIQRGETWSLDFDITNVEGEPFMMLKEWQNPFLVITVTAARYVQEGDYRHSWWLDLTQRYVEDVDGNITLEPVKRFTGTEALYLDADDFSISEVMSTYGRDPDDPESTGRIVTELGNDFDVTNFLFYVDPNHDGNRIYKYCKSYTLLDARFDRARIVVDRIYESIDDLSLSDDGWIVAIRDPNSLVGSNVYQLCYVYRTDLSSIQLSTVCFMIQTYTSGITPTELVFYVTRTSPESSSTNPSINGSIWVDPVNIYGNIYVRRWATGRDYRIFYNKNSLIYTGTSTTDEVWEEYELRIVKSFTTIDWVEQGYLYDIKVLSGELVEESVRDYLINEGKEVSDLPWSDEELQAQIERIDNTEMRAYYQEIFDTGAPLMPTYDTKLLVLKPTNLYVSANIQKGI